MYMRISQIKNKELEDILGLLSRKGFSGDIIKFDNEVVLRLKRRTERQENIPVDDDAEWVDEIRWD